MNPEVQSRPFSNLVRFVALFSILLAAGNFTMAAERYSILVVQADTGAATEKEELPYEQMLQQGQQEGEKGSAIILAIVIAAAVGAIVPGLLFYFTRRPREIGANAVESDGRITRDGTTKLPFDSVDARESYTEADSPPSSRPNLSVSISHLELTNIRSFSNLDLQFANSGDGKTSGSWALLLGDNGVGKSTILRSLVLALADPDVATALLQTQESPVPYIRRREKGGTIRVCLNDQFQYALEIRPGKGSEKLTVLENPSYRPDIFAYGPQRGSAVGRSARQVSYSSIAPIATLFDESAELIHAETWLLQRKFAAMQSSGGDEEVFFDAVTEMLCELLPGVELVEVTSTGVNLSGSEVGDSIPLAGMSDGYLGTMGWVLDFVARWSHRYERNSGSSVGDSMTTQARGLVFVDEIGLHLHPLWQTSIIADVRARFPNMSFVSTSHHPLTLIGAEQGEIYVLRRNTETSAVDVEQANIPPGITADQILTGRWFNLSSTLDDGTKALIEEHRSLLRDGAGEDDQRVETLEEELRFRLGAFADTSIDRMALQVAAEVMQGKESSFEKLTPERKEEIRQEMLADLRDRTLEKY